MAGRVPIHGAEVVARARRPRAPSRSAAPGAPAWPVAAALGLAVIGGAAVGTGQWQLAMGAVASVLFVIGAAASPERTALGVVVALPFFVYPVSVGRFSVFLAIPVVAFVSLLLVMRQQGAIADLRRALPIKAFVVLAGVAAFTAALSSDPRTAGSRVLYLVLFGVFAWGLATALLSGRLTRTALVRAVVLGGALAAAAVAAQVLYGLSVGRGGVTDWLNSVYPLFGGQRAALTESRNWWVEDVGVVRGVFPFMAAPSAGQFLMLSLVAAVWLRRERSARTSVGATLETLAVVLIAVGLLLTYSRQSWVGLVVGLLALGATRRGMGTLIAVGCGLVLLAAVPVPGGEGTFADHLLRSGDTSTTSSNTRVGLWEQAIDLIPEHAVVGVGPGLYGTLNPNPENPIYYAHNIFLDVAVELGILGALALVAVLLLAMRTALARRASLGFAMLAAFAAASLFDDVLYFPRNGLLVAVAFALCAVGDRRTPARAVAGSAPP